MYAIVDLINLGFTISWPLRIFTISWPKRTCYGWIDIR